jgi:radical SAM protein with 4Fe4S-binding SPASM domain
MLEDDAIQLLQTLRHYGILLVEFTGGEPLLHPAFRKLLQYALKNFELVSILTNSYYIDEELIEVMREYRHKLIISTTLYSSSQELHDSFCGVKGAFQQTCAKVQLLIKSGIRVRISTVIMPENYAEIESIIALAKKLGAVLFTYSPVFELGRARGKSWKLSEEQTMELEQNLKRSIKKWGKFIQIAPEYIAEWIKEHGCGAGWRAFVINPLGEVRPCILMPNDYIPMGNILRDGFEAVFRKAIVKRLYELKPPSETFCQGCEKLSFCQPCYFRGILSYKSLGEKCNWAVKNEVSSLLKEPSGMF